MRSLDRLRSLFRLALAAPVLLALAGAVSGCIFGGEGGKDPLRSAPLSATGLVGDWEMFDFRIEFSDGQVIDGKSTPLTARLHVTADSTYLQRVWIDVAPDETRGDITEVRVRGQGHEGRVTVTLDGTENTAACDFTISGDTLTWVAVHSGKNLGYTETSRYARISPVALRR